MDMLCRIRLLALLLLALALPAFSLDITEAEGIYTVTAAGYTARLSAPKLLFSLQTEGRELLSEGTASWLQNTWAPVTVSREGNSLVCVKKDFGRAVYDFGEDRIRVSVVNDTRDTLRYSTVLADGYDAVVLAGGLKAYPVTEARESRVRFNTGRQALEFSGDMLVTGPEGRGQLIELFTPAGRTGTLEIAPARAGAGEEEEAARLRQPALYFDRDEDISLYSPREWQVFQRRTRARGEIVISGRVRVPCDRLEYSLTGTNFAGHRLSGKPEPIPLAPDGSFSLKAETASGGWYRLSLTARKGGAVTGRKEIERTGVGEIIVSSGQSNSTNRAAVRMHSRLQMAAATDGTEWRLCDDPMPGQHDSFDGHQGGSLYPPLGDYLYEALRVPIAFASTGHGGMEAKYWLPGSELYSWMTDRLRQLGKGGFRCVIWHQGESEQFADTTADEYYDTMALIIRASVCDAGWQFPWFVAKASLMSADTGMYEPVRQAQQRLWDTGVALAGPDTDTLVGDYREYDGKGAHFTPSGLEAHARLWSYILADHIRRQP
ncbi:MAG: hypothetical protein IK083_11145 [Abditibacteriota bacterium]|nr:hypothetical protein [Abditibacteriota bacterium]